MTEVEPARAAPCRQGQRLASAAIAAGVLALGAVVFGTLEPVEGLEFTAFTRTTWNGQVLLTGRDTTLSLGLVGERPFTEWQSYSVEWRGRLAVPSAGAYTFALAADDGAIFEVGDRVVVDNGGQHRSRRLVGAIELSPGLHDVRLRYAQEGGRYDLDLRWSRDGELFTPIPAGRLVPPGVSPAAYRWRWLWPPLGALVAVLVGWLAASPLRRRLAAAFARPLTKTALDALARPRVAIALIVALGLPVRMALLTTSPAVLWPDSTVFHFTSRDILRGVWASHDAYRTAAYPFLLTAVVGGRDSELLGLVLIGLQQIAGLGAAVLFFMVGRRVVAPRPALAGALLFAIHPLQLFYEVSVLTEAIFTLGLAGTVWAAMRLLERPAATAAALFGALTALLVLIRPVAQWYLPAVLALLLACRGRRAPILRAGVVAVVCYAVPILGWMSVNQAEFGFFGVALGRGMGLYTRVFEVDAMRPPSPGSDREMRALWSHAVVERWSPNRVRDELNYGSRMSAAAADERMYDFAKETALAHVLAFSRRTLVQWGRLVVAPLDSIRRCPSPVGHYLCSGRSTGESLPSFPNAPSEPSRVREATVAYVSRVRWPMLTISLLALAGAGVALSEATTLASGALLLVTIACMTLVPAVSQYPLDRFRLPIDALLFLFAAGGLRYVATVLVAITDTRARQ